MRGRSWSRGWARLGAVWFTGLMLLGGMFVASRQGSALAWTETSQGDFLGGSFVNATATPAGDVVLASAGVQPVKRGIVLGLGSAGAADSVRAYWPFVLREADGTYKMWYTGSDGSRFRLMFADSPDGIAWTKHGVVINVLTAPYSFDSVGTGSVIKEGSTYHMWFTAGYWTGGPFGYYTQAYYATSTDGQAWSIQGLALGRGSTGSWDEGSVSSPWVMWDGSAYRMYYTGWDGTTVRLGLATSSSHTGFVRGGGNPIVSVGPAGAWDDAQVQDAAVVPGAPWTLYYAASDGTTWRMGVASSSDGLTWTKAPGNPFLAGDPAPAWDSNGIVSPAYVDDPSGARLYYSGASGSQIQVGLAALAPTYAAAGRFTSRVFDSGAAGTVWQTIAWNATTPASTALALSVRSGDAPAPDGTWSAWSAVSGSSGGTPLSQPRTRYAQYRADLATSNASASPALHDVTIAYARNQGPAALALSPAGGAWLRSATPTLAWTPSDPEGDGQAAFEVQLSPDPGFTNVLSSGERTSSVPRWQPPPLAEGAWYWRVRLQDTYGAWGGWSSDSFGLDVTPPSALALPAGTTGAGGWFTGPVTVTITASDASSGVASITYRADGGAWQSYANPFSVAADGVHALEYYATDVAGNMGLPGILVLGIDATPPTTTSTLYGPVGDDGWYTGTVAVALGAADASSGVAGTTYRVGGGSWLPYAAPFNVTGDGSRLVEYRSTDVAGNVEVVRSRAFQIDTQAPASSLALAGPLGSGGWYTGAVTGTLTATDGTSGVRSRAYRIDGGSWVPYTTPFQVSGDGTHVVEYRSTDNANLTESAQSVPVKIDTAAPTTTAILSGTLGNASFYTTPVTVVLAATDATSGLATTEYALDQGSWQPYTGPIYVPDPVSHHVDFRSTDRAGLVEAIRSVAFQMDLLPPDTLASLAGPVGVKGFYTGPVTVTLLALDPTSDVADTEYSVDGGAWQAYTGAFRVTGDGPHTVGFYSVDHAGLREPTRVVEFSIDTGALSPTGPFGPWILVLLIAILAAFLALLVGFVAWRRKRKGKGKPEAAEQ